MAFVSGTQRVINNLNRELSMMHRNIAEAVGVTCVTTARVARENHEQGIGHAKGTYEYKTGALTQSIRQELTKVSADTVEGIVISDMEYAAHVELGTVGSKPYPFLFPALAGQKDQFAGRLRKALGQ